jgi:mono/diheme cytochrome c family protein
MPRFGVPLVCLWLLVFDPAEVSAQPQAERVSRGIKLLKMQGCTGCHSLDGSVSAGPSFAGRFGSEVSVIRDGNPGRVRFDRAYLRASLEEPEAMLAVGFAPGVMPRFELTDEQLDAIADALAQLQSPSAPQKAPISALWLYGLSAGLLAVGLGAWLSRKRRPAPPQV